ncbi:MaoC/PaaZ C-terminal domain-containing protein [Pseudolysinimonas kribbensis]|uniref:MaoC/PaaZ C-terminal domain-containing protein n=1 Tax=Pseudolysinimonas kribbensis TaxID=433641 RepID=UPI0031D74BA6
MTTAGTGPFPLHFEDLATGLELVSGARTVTETDLVQFAMLSGDWNPIHVDEEFARDSVFGRRVVHGVCGLAIMGGLIFSAGWFSTTVEALLGFDEMRFRTPLFVGDTVRCRFTVAELRITSTGRGLVTRRLELVNQRGDVVLETLSPILIARASERADGKADDAL